jgi:hypothetical protein
VRWLVVAMGSLMLVGCGSSEIEGSLSTILDLEYDSVKLAYTGGQSVNDTISGGILAVRFLKASGDQAENAVLVVSEDLSGLTVQPTGQVNLAEVPPSGVGQRGVVTRDVFNDPRKTFPTLQQGYMKLDSTPVPGSGETVSGFFTVTFSLCVDFGCGRTAFASFKAQVQ